VPINHKDMKGRTAMDLAKLYNNRSVLDYLKSLDPNVNNEKVEYWKTKAFKQKYNLSTWALKQF